MKKILCFVVAMISIGFLFSFQACKDNSPVKESGFEFDYFPQKNIYFNVQSSNFIYSLDGTKTWDSLKVTSKEGFALLGKKERIFSKSAEVWKDNEAHLKMYEGKPFNVLSESDKIDVASVEEVSDKKSAIKPGSDVKKAEPPKKKGIRGFFDRVFKKKDKSKSG